MNNGFVSLHRKILENPITKNSTYFHLWVLLLLLANHKDESSFIWNGKPMKIKRGQLLTGRDKLAELSGIPPTTIERILKYLENGQMIGQQTFSKFRIITIINYNEYQKVDRKTDNRWTTDGQQMDTFNNDNNVNNENNINTGEVVTSPGSEINNLISKFKPINPSFKNLYANKTQRGALARMVKEHGLEKMEEVITLLPEIVTRPYAPKITTPIQLEKDFGKLIIYMAQEKVSRKGYADARNI